MRPPQDSVRKTITREASLFLGLLLIGLVLLPVAVYIVGQAIFGDYGGGSYGLFFSELSGRIRTADPAACCRNVNGNTFTKRKVVYEVKRVLFT
jgi:hypothetical protein